MFSGPRLPGHVSSVRGRGFRGDLTSSFFHIIPVCSVTTLKKELDHVLLYTLMCRMNLTTSKPPFAFPPGKKTWETMHDPYRRQHVYRERPSINRSQTETFLQSMEASL